MNQIHCKLHNVSAIITRQIFIPIGVHRRNDEKFFIRPEKNAENFLFALRVQGRSTQQVSVARGRSRQKTTKVEHKEVEIIYRVVARTTY